MQDEQITSHSETVQPETQSSENELSAAYEAFGLDLPVNNEEAAQGETEASDDVYEDNTEPPAIEESRKLRVKYNKQEIEIDDDKIPELVEKGLGLDKERERRNKYESALQRAAKLAGYEKVDDYLSNLDLIEQQVAKQQQDQFDQLRQSLKAEADDAGLDPDRVEEWLNNHPVLNQAKSILEREKHSEQLKKQELEQQRAEQAWQELFVKYPHLAKEMPEDGSLAPWFTPEMQARIQRGYDPIDAYELVHRDSLMSEQRKRAEQDVLKQQRLNKRAAVESDTKQSLEPEAPTELVEAFKAFGIDPSKAKKYAKK